MNDTSPEVRELLAERYRLLTPQERVRMCAEMFETARALVEASFPPGLPDLERRRRICERFYGSELTKNVFAVSE